MRCPVCGEDGEHMRGTPRMEQLHFVHRALWDSHRLRQALEVGGRYVLAQGVSRIIRRIDRLVAILLDDDRDN